MRISSGSSVPRWTVSRETWVPLQSLHTFELCLASKQVSILYHLYTSTRWFPRVLLEETEVMAPQAVFPYAVSAGKQKVTNFKILYCNLYIRGNLVRLQVSSSFQSQLQVSVTAPTRCYNMVQDGIKWYQYNM